MLFLKEPGTMREGVPAVPVYGTRHTLIACTIADSMHRFHNPIKNNCR